MKSSSKGQTGLMLKGSVSLVALTAMAATLVSPAFAQTAPAATDTSADDAQQVVVVGVRRSLKTAQQIKKDADTVVDSITATDIGAFPDKSVAEALQRVAGITVTRFAATGDTAHFSAEPSGVLVRGLQQVRSEFNGRDTFSANSSRGLSWGDVSPELMSGVDTYKNQTAELIEGGIAGSINLRTRVPFDSKGQLIAISADASYGDVANKATGDISGIYSNRWDTDMGEFGAMFNYAHSNVVTATNGIILGRMGSFCDDPNSHPDSSHAAYTDQFGVAHDAYSDPNKDSVELNSDGSIPCSSSPYGTHGWAYMPSAVTYAKNSYDRTRDGIAFAGQWQNHDHTLLATVQYNDSKYANAWEERNINVTFSDIWAAPPYNPIGATGVQSQTGDVHDIHFADNGLFQTGALVSPMGWWGNPGTDPKTSDSSHVAQNDQGNELVHACYGWDGCTPVQQGLSTVNATRFNDNNEYTRDFSANLKWDINDHLKSNFDVQYVKSEVSNYDIGVGIDSFTNAGFDMSGKYPKITEFTTPTNVNLSTGGLQNPNNYRYGYVQDHYEDSDGTELAVRSDLEYDFDGDSWLSSLKVGVRYADRDQSVRWGNYNWANIANTWTTSYTTAAGCTGNQSEYYNIDKGANGCFGGYSSGLTEINTIGQNFFGGKDVIPEHDFVYNVMDRLKDEKGLAAALGLPTLGVGTWYPYCSAAGNRSDETTTVNGHCYRPSELLAVSERTLAGYAELKFGGPDKTIFNGIGVSGNVGVRWVQTDDTTDGFEQINNDTWYTSQLTDVGPGKAYTSLADKCANAPIIPGSSVTNIACWLTPDLQAFSNSGSLESKVHKEHINWLPSFNVRFKLNDQWQVRFAASRAMSRPDLGYLKNYISVSSPSTDVSPASSHVIYNSPNAAHTAANVVGYDFQFTGSAGNPYLKPTIANQFDISVEDYFASVGSFTMDLFYKKFENYIQYGNYIKSITNNGVTIPVKVNGPVNADGAAIKGFEIAYTRYFDFLPAPFDGFGIQSNYTHVVNSGITNTNVVDVANDGNTNSAGGGNAQVNGVINPHSLEGLSADSYNLVGMYEKGPWAARVAYNWRSKFLVTSLDCCTGVPMWQAAFGQLDGSIRYKVNDNIEINLEGSNLNGADTVLLQQTFGDSKLTPGAKDVLTPASWFKQDRRIQVGIRLKY